MVVESGPFFQLAVWGLMQQQERCHAPLLIPSVLEPSPPRSPQETGPLLRQKIPVPAYGSEVSAVTAPFLSEEPSRSLSGTPPGCHPLPGWTSLAMACFCLTCQWTL